MDSEALRAAVTELEERLRTLDVHRNVLVRHMAAINTEEADIVATLDGLKRLLGVNATTQAPQAASATGMVNHLPGLQGGGIPRSHMTMKMAIRWALRGAVPDGLTVHDLWEQMQALGVRSSSTNPLNVVDTTILEMRKGGEPIELVGKRTYQWTGEKSEMLTPVFPPAHNLTFSSDAGNITIPFLSVEPDLSGLTLPYGIGPPPKVTQK